MRGQETLFRSARSKSGRDKGSTDDWGTPFAFYKLLDDEFHFTLDPCASADNAKCAYFDINDDGLAQDWGDNVCFVNFPYSAAKAWAEKCVQAAADGATVVVLCAARTDTKWWQYLAQYAEEVRFVFGRLRFVAPKSMGKLKGESAGFPSSVLVLRPGLEQTEHEGQAITCMRLWDVPLEQRR